MNLEGKILGNRYEIIEKISNGGMATVYKSKDSVLNRYVAIKVLRDEFTTDEEFIKRFRIEAQSAASLTHPNIVSIYDVGNEGSLYYIVMELIKGKTLKEIITEEKGPLPWKWSLNIVIQIASALEMAHKNNIVHRDIKPHNIIITEDGVAKVTDFGIAKAVSNSTITAFGTTIGSVHYFSPEHARGGYTDAKSDLYSLGVVMYEMLTGRVPFDADTPVSVALKHMQEKPVEPKELNPSIPQSVNDIIMKAMQKDTNLRYQSATEMLKDLNEALKSPEANFVQIGEDMNAATQRISTQEIQEAERKAREQNGKKPNKFKELILKHKVLSGILGTILLFFLVFGVSSLIFNMAFPDDVELPNFVNMTQEEAEQTAEELNLKLVIGSEEFSPDVEAGKIISQDPEYQENYMVKERSEITVIVSKGTEKTTVPKVEGMTREEAEKALEEANLTAEITEENDEEVEAGIVISQDIDPNTEIDAGSVVKIVVSKGSGIVMVKVPSLVGKTEQEAKDLLESANLEVNVVNDEDDSKDNGVVLRQNRDAGEEVEEGTTITITVNKVAETKTANFTINVKSITGGYEETEENPVEESSKKVYIVITVDGNEAFTQPGVDTNDTITANVSGKGSKSVIVTLTDGNGKKYTRSITFNFNNTTKYTFE